MTPQLFFSIVADHKYFSNGKCGGLSIEPAPDCVKLLNKYRLLCKFTREGDVLTFCTDTQVHALQKDTKAVFNFRIYADDPDFQEYTRLPPQWPHEIQYFSNKTPTGLVTGSLHPSSVQNLANQEATCKRLYGLITLHNNNLSGNRFLLSFDAAGCIWKYYLLGYGKNQSLFIDSSLSSINLEKMEDAPDEVAGALMKTFPDASVTRYVSAGEIPFQEMGVKDIRLMNNNTVHVNHLPNPTLRDNGIKIINMMHI